MIAKMADSTQPWLIPNVFTVPPQAVVIYPDGRYAWPPKQVERFDRHISLSTDPASGLLIAHIARGVDFENGDYNAAEAAAVIQARIDGTIHGREDATLYCSRDKIRAFLDERPEGPPRWFIATLDNKPWTPQTLAEDIAQTEHVTIPAERIWAIQNQRANGYDVSDVFGARDFDRHHPALLH